MTNNDKLEKLKKLADAMYYAAQQLTTDASRLHKAMDEYHKFIIYEYKEEPASEEQVKESLIFKHDDKTCKENGNSLTQEEDLKEAAKHYLYSNILYDDVYVGNPTDKDCIEMFKAGAEWQKQQMTANAADMVVGYWMPNGLMLTVDETENCYNIDEGDRVKVIVIKEE